MNTKQLVLEAAHTYTIYTMLVPNGRLLKWADIMLYAVEALESDDEKMREQAHELFKAELERLTFEPIYALVKSIVVNLPNDAKLPEVSTKIEEKRQNLKNLAKKIKTEIDAEGAKPDLVELKYKLIDGLNDCFEYLNRVQDFQYPEIQPSTTMMPEALRNA